MANLLLESADGYYRCTFSPWWERTLPADFTSALNWAQVAATVVTALATGALVWATIVLAKYTRKMAESASKPHIVVTLEPNPWSIIHFDLITANTGNAVAYDINAEFKPPLPSEQLKEHERLPLQRLSVLRPGQSLSTYVAEYAALKGKSFEVTVNWKPFPKAKVQTQSYVLNIADYDAMIRLGGGDPSYKIAEHLKHMREDWQQIARGSRRIDVDIFTKSDRDQEREAQRQWVEQVKKKNQGKKPPP